MKPIRIRNRNIVLIALYLFIFLFMLASWNSTAFSDFYTRWIFPLWGNTYGRLTSLTSVSVGERLILVGVFVLIVTALITLACLIWCICKLVRKLRKHRKPMEASRGDLFPDESVSEQANQTGESDWPAPDAPPVPKAPLPLGIHLAGHWYYGFVWLVAIVAVIMVLNCFVLYHCSRLVINPDAPAEYTLSDLAEMRDSLVSACNSFAPQMPRGKDGQVVYEGGQEAMAREARASMQKLSALDKRLGGFYVTPKALTFSGFMSQQYMQGYYFPFSMESNYNNLMAIMNKPFTMCHELAHTHGYIYEDEANMLGFLGCMASDDPVFHYSGLIGVLNYVNNDFYRAVDLETYRSHVAISDLVYQDDIFLTEEAWKVAESHALFKTKTVQKAADTFIDGNLKANGVKSGKVSYSHVVKLLLDWYAMKKQ